MADAYEGTKITEIETLASVAELDTAKVLVVTSDNQYLVTMPTLVEYLRTKLNG